MKRSKKILAFVLMAVMAIGMCVPTVSAASDTGFSDVDANAWYAGAVTYC